MKIKLLNELYCTLSPSHKEHGIANIVKRELERMKIPFEQDKYLQIYNINARKPLMVAHMDQVQSVKCHKVMSFKNKIYGFDKKGNLSGLGADDKNGVFIILNMIEKFREEISFIFSTAEEQGGNLSALTENIDLSSTPYGLIFDRKGSSDIIGTSNNYCCDDLETAIQVIGAKQGYSPSRGIFSDGDELSRHVPCVNLSCGYYNAHSKDEYVKPSELWNAMQLAEVLISNLPNKNNPFELPEQFILTSKDPGWSYSTGKFSKTEYDDINISSNFTQIEIDHNGVYFYDNDGEEVFLEETKQKAVGVYNMNPGKLSVSWDKKTDELKATFNGVPVEIIDIVEMDSYLEEDA